MGALGLALVATACLLAAACGFSLWRAYEAQTRLRRHKASIAGASDKAASSFSLADRVVAHMERTSRSISLARARRVAPEGMGAGKGFESMARLAGLEGRVSPEGFVESKARLALLGAAAGAVCGLLFSAGLAIALAVAGALTGWRMPGHALRTRAALRAHEAERHLPEMLDVVSLGMRSGLSFDASLHIYASHFDTLLSQELERARIQWSSGLARRDEALRAVASTYDSAVFARVVETMARSIRYGSSMVASLERDAAEARSAYRSEREERIAKAPVKMMVPTGVLILPAMLVMVLGPVLLELVEGGF